MIALNFYRQLNINLQDATLSQGRPRDAAVNFGTHMKFTAASRSHSFCCDSNAFELNNKEVYSPRRQHDSINNSISHGKITVLNISIYCP